VQLLITLLELIENLIHNGTYLYSLSGLSFCRLTSNSALITILVQSTRPQDKHIPIACQYH